MPSRTEISPRKSPRQARARRTVDAILEAAAQLLRRGAGPDAFTTDRIAELAGVSIGTLYQYFPNKAAVVVGVADRELTRLLALLLGHAALDGSRDETAERYVRALLDTIGRDEALHRALAQELPRLAADDCVRDHNARALAAVRGFLERHAAEGHRRDLGAEAYVLLHATRGVALARLTDEGGVDRDAVARSLTGLVVSFLRAVDG